MSEVLSVVLMVSLLAAFMVLLVKKWGIAEWMQVHGCRMVSELFSCDLCMSFWACVIVSGMALMVTGEVICVVLPFMATPVTRMIV